MLRFLRLSFFLHCQLWMIGFESVAPWFTLPEGYPSEAGGGFYHQPGKWAVQSRGKTKEFRCAQCLFQKSQGGIPMILWEFVFVTGQAVFQIWVPFWKSHAFQKGFVKRIFRVQMFDAVQPRKPRNYGKKDTMPGSFHWFKGRHKHKHNTTHFVMKSMQRQYFSTIFEN